MQRKALKVGTAYGVVPDFSKSAWREAYGPATLVSMTAEYDKPIGSYGRRTVKMEDGLAFTFDHDVMKSYRHFRAARPEDREKHSVFGKLILAGETVIIPAKCVVDEWKPIEEMRARHEAERRESAQRIDREGDVTEPIVRAVTAELVARGLTEQGGFSSGDTGFGLRLDHRKGVEKERVIGARYTFEVEALANLLGIAVKP